MSANSHHADGRPKPGAVFGSPSQGAANDGRPANTAIALWHCPIHGYLEDASTMSPTSHSERVCMVWVEQHQSCHEPVTGPHQASVSAT